MDNYLLSSLDDPDFWKFLDSLDKPTPLTLIKESND